jgi:hypothetical protein
LIVTPPVVSAGRGVVDADAGLGAVVAVVDVGAVVAGAAVVEGGAVELDGMLTGWPMLV